MSCVMLHLNHRQSRTIFLVCNDTDGLLLQRQYVIDSKKEKKTARLADG